jgi:RimJ/RimL family protein N-acetyltransferase
VARTNEHGQGVGDDVPGWQPRPRPARVALTGRTASLEPVGPEHAESLYAALCGPEDAALWTYRSQEMPADRATSDALVRALADAEDTVTFAIVPVDGVASGHATLMRVDAERGSLEVGGIIYARSLQRTVAATEAMWLLMRHVFDDLGYRRYEWKLDHHNAPSAAAARRLGFVYEGRFRHAMVYKGRNRDTDWSAMTDDDFARLRPAYDRWLDPANFDENGRQRISLAALTAGRHPVRG